MIIDVRDIIQIQYFCAMNHNKYPFYYKNDYKCKGYHSNSIFLCYEVKF